jgi:hypothetical protein
MTRGPARLSISATALRAAFATLNRLLPARSRKSGELVLSFAGGLLAIEGPGAGLEVAATGTWPGRARVSASITKMMATAPPDGDPLMLGYSEGRLVLAGSTTLRFKAAWEDISPARLEIPIDATDRDLLRVADSQTSAELTSAGLTGLVCTAEQRFQKVVDLTHAPLAKYGVARSRLEVALRALITDRPAPPTAMESTGPG